MATRAITTTTSTMIPAVKPAVLVPFLGLVAEAACPEFAKENKYHFWSKVRTETDWEIQWFVNCIIKHNCYNYRMAVHVIRSVIFTSQNDLSVFEWTCCLKCLSWVANVDVNIQAECTECVLRDSAEIFPSQVQSVIDASSCPYQLTWSPLVSVW